MSLNWSQPDPAYTGWKSEYDALQSRKIDPNKQVMFGMGGYNKSASYTPEETARLNALQRQGEQSGWIKPDVGFAGGMKDAFLNPAVLSAAGGMALQAGGVSAFGGAPAAAPAAAPSALTSASLAAPAAAAAAPAAIAPAIGTGAGIGAGVTAPAAAGGIMGVSNANLIGGGALLAGALAGKTPSPPGAPDPYKTAQAQTDTNLETARAQARINRVNSTTPFGSTTYTEGPNDTWSSNVSLAPALKSGVDSSIGQIGENLRSPFSLGSLPAAPTVDNAERQRVADEMMARLEPKFAQDDESLRTRLANQGINVGTEAYRREMETAGQNRNDARVQADIASGDEMARIFGLGTQARTNAMNEQTIARQMPINEMNALVTGSQLPQPSGVSLNPADISGNIYANYQGQQDAYNQKIAAQNATKSGLFNLGGTALMASMLRGAA